MEAVQEFISITPWTVVFSICNLLILCALLKKFLFKPVQKVLEDRQKELDATYSEAESQRKQAEALREQYDMKLSGARSEADTIVQNATRSAQKRSEEIVSEAIVQGVQLKQRAQSEIEQQRRKAYTELSREISGMAVDIAEKVVGREITDRDQQALVDDFIRNAGDEQ